MSKNLTALNFFIIAVYFYIASSVQGGYTELIFFYNVELLKLKPRLSLQNCWSKPHTFVASTHAKAKLKLRQAVQTAYLAF